ncbi:amidohydrolase, partial [Alphaproteobacteria bacterium]|nr:amidohydrolase [Alphaproteobacteria bacterium]
MTKLLKIFSISLLLMFSYEKSSLAENSNNITIDVHTHIFNGEDVPLDGFIEEIALHISSRNLLGQLLKPLIRPLTSTIQLWADGHEQENNQLDELLIKGGHQNADGHPAIPPLKITTQQLLKPGYQTSEALKDKEQLEQLAGELNVGVSNLELENVLEEECKSDFAFHLRSIQSWVRKFTAPRHCNVKRLLKTYGDKGKIDFFVSATVDLDYWLKGRTKTQIEDQVIINSKLSVLSQGRILPVVGFDPYRDVIEKGKAFQIVQTAILDYGFVGIKLYPPMGFKPLGNKAEQYSKVKNKIWGKPHWGVPALSDREFAIGIEQSLNRLYAWAEMHGVPIMAHANKSNYSRKEFKNFAHPKNWEAVLKTYPELKINLAHFGGMDSLTGQKKRWAQSIISLMNKYDNLYADTGNFKLRKRDGFFKYLEELKSYLNRPNSILGTRLMYGSDWFMHAARSYSEDYPNKLKKSLEKAKMPAQFITDFRGLNAVEFLGLREGEATRGRLDTF